MAVTTTNLGVITAYGDAVAAGYTGTKAEWQTLMASYATVGQQAVDAKNDAVAAKDTAVSKATEATTAANTATTKAGEASASAQSIAQSASQIAQNTSDISELKEDFAQMESDGVVPSAEQIISDKYTEDKVPYHYRKTGGDGADRLYDQIVGGTVCWNQLARTSQVDASKTQNGVTITDNRDGTYTVSTDANGATANTYSSLSNANVTLKGGHKYLLCGTPSTGSANTYYSYMAGTVTIYDYGKGVIFTAPTDGAVTLVVAYVKQGTVITTAVTFKPQVIDLTAMFGSTVADYIYQLEQTTAGAGVAFFKALFPNDYYPYDTGTLKSVEGLSEHKMVGFNQWDEEWESGSYNSFTGEKQADSSKIRCKNLIEILPNTVYYKYCGAGDTKMHWNIYYDANGNYLSRSGSNANGTFTTPSDAYYMSFNCESTYGNTYNHDICISLSDPAKNGTYKPYKAHSYPLDSTLTLRGLFKLDANNNLYANGDTYDADGTVTRRYGIVDLGALDWAYITASQVFRADLPSMLRPSALLCSNYTQSFVTQVEDVPDKTIWNRSYAFTLNNVVIKDSAYTGATVFKTALSGVMLVYELATPTIEEAEPYQHLQQCDPNGTEEYVTTGIVPVGHETRYPENLRAKIEGLPWDFSSLIAPTEKTNTASRNYTTGSLLIMGNVLYKVTANIANGGTITPNTNVTATTLSEILSALAQ